MLDYFNEINFEKKIFFILLFLFLLSNIFKSQVKFITYEKAADQINSFDFIIDVRSKEEIKKGRLMSYNLITMESLAKNPKLMKFLPKKVSKDDKILIYCESGRRSKIAAELFIKNGFTNVYTISNGGYQELIKSIIAYEIWYEDHIV